MKSSISSHMAGMAQPHEMEPEKGNPEPEGEQGIGHHLMTQAHEAEPDGKHMHIHHDGVSHTTHHVAEDGKVEGPHHHENLEAVKAHMGKVFGEEEHDGGYEHKSSGGHESLFGE